MQQRSLHVDLTTENKHKKERQKWTRSHFSVTLHPIDPNVAYGYGLEGKYREQAQERNLRKD